MVYFSHREDATMGIGTKLSELMDANHTNACELAKKVDISPQTIYSIIRRDSNKVDIDLLAKLAYALGVKLDYFVEESESPVTIAAHFDGDEFTEDELDEIRQFASFIKLRNRKK